MTLETIRPWEKNPDSYSSGITESAFALMERTFASPDARLRSLIAREKQMPATPWMLPLARICRTRRTSPQRSLEQLPGSSSFSNRMFLRLSQQRGTAVSRRSSRNRMPPSSPPWKAIQAWLKSDLLAGSNGDFRIGADTYQQKLEYDEMVDTPLPKLLQVAYTDMRKNQGEFSRVALARAVDPMRKPRRSFSKSWSRDHPAPGDLLQSFRDTFNGLVQFIQEKHIVDIPAGGHPIVEETPPFMRATTVASMDTPGPYEKVAKEAYFNVTLPGPHDSPATDRGA